MEEYSLADTSKSVIQKLKRYCLFAVLLVLCVFSLVAYLNLIVLPNVVPWTPYPTNISLSLPWTPYPTNISLSLPWTPYPTNISLSLTVLKIHQTFNKPLDDKLSSATSQWILLNPLYLHNLSNDSTNLNLLRTHFPEYLTLYTNLPTNIERADLWRYLILLSDGGLYTDIDTIPVKPIAEWPRCAMQFVPQREEYESIDTNSVVLVGVEAVVNNEQERIRMYFARQVQLVQWTIYASQPGHPVFRGVAERILKKWSEDRDKPVSKGNVFRILDSTGPGIWTDAVMGYLNATYGLGSLREVLNGRCFGKEKEDGKVLSLDLCVLPINAFASGSGHSGAGSHEAPDVLAWHMFYSSWKSFKMRIAWKRTQVLK